MNIRDTIKPYYHQLYQTLKSADNRLKKLPTEELIGVMIEDIVRLDALISMLVYVDGSLPLIRTQKAFSLLKNELQALSYLFREQRLLENKRLNFLDWKLGESISFEIDLLSDEINKQSHDLYLNAIHAGQSAIEEHMKELSDQKIIIGILAYFTDCIENIKEKNIDTELHDIGYLVRGLLANLKFIVSYQDLEESFRQQGFTSILKNFIQNVKLAHIYDLILNAIGPDQTVLSGVGKDIRGKYGMITEELVGQYDRLVNESALILDFIKSHLIQDLVVPEKSLRESIHARNLMHSLT